MKISAYALLGLLFATPAMAGSGPPTTPIMGTIASAANTGAGGYYCSIALGQAQFQRNAATARIPNATAMISLPEVDYFNPKISAETRLAVGVVRLIFSSATAGKMKIDLEASKANSPLPTGDTVAFTDYSQVWSASDQTLEVSFNLAFSHCPMTFKALFRAEP
jgi:hypothetical protein